MIGVLQGTMTADRHTEPQTGASSWLAPRHRLVRVLSWALIAVAGGLIALLVVRIGMFEPAAPSRPPDVAGAPVSDKIVVTTSTVTGFDRDDQPYTLTAATAVQDGSEPNRVHLETVTGALRRRSGEVLNIAARTALYDSKAETLDLVGDVKLQDGRFVADMAKAQVTLDDKRFRSTVPVVVTFNGGEIAAGGLEIVDDGQRILFFNRVKAQFRPATKEDRRQ